MTQDYQSLALGYAEELSDLKRRYANLERHCRGLESKLSKTRDRMRMYRERCKAWERALAKAYELFHLVGKEGKTHDDQARAYGIMCCAAVIRKEVEPAYCHDPAKIRRKVLNRTNRPEAEESGEQPRRNGSKATEGKANGNRVAEGRRGARGSTGHRGDV